MQESGHTVAEALELILVMEAGLDGPHHGEADGHPWYEVKNAFRGAPDMHQDRPWAVGSETWNSFLRRATAFLSTLLERHEGDRIVLAAHGETIIAAHTLLLGLSPLTRATFITEHASLTRWQRHQNRFGDRRHRDRFRLTGLLA